MLAAGPPSLTTGPAPSVHQFRHLNVIVLDPGHGGRNKGCLGVDGTYEKVVVLQIAKRVERILNEETTAAVLLTRRDDRFLGLGERSALANSWGGDVFLSLHLNADAYGRGAGVETWFLAADDEDATEGASSVVSREEQDYGQTDTLDGMHRHRLQALVDEVVRTKARQDSELLARDVSTNLWKRTKAIHRGVKQARFGVLKAAAMPAIVVEGGFFSHHKEGLKLKEAAYQEKIARAIVDGLIAFDRRIGGTPSQ